MPLHQPHPGDSSSLSATAPSRRKVLLGMAATGVAVVGGGVVACGSDEDPSDAAPPTEGTTGAPTDSPSSPSASASPDGSESPAETATGEAPQGIAVTADIPVGGGRIFEDERVVITQPSTGTFRAFTAVCTHQGCTVGSVRDGLITCPCHGSQFRVDDGSVARGPATAALAERAITVQDGSIVLS